MLRNSNKKLPHNHKEALDLIRFLDAEMVKTVKMKDKRQQSKYRLWTIENAKSIFHIVKKNSEEKDLLGSLVYPKMKDAVKLLSIWLIRNQRFV